MKKAMSIMLGAGLMASGLATYCLMNQDTKKNADKLLNTAMDTANKNMKNM